MSTFLLLVCRDIHSMFINHGAPGVSKLWHHMQDQGGIASVSLLPSGFQS
uniref:Uncharacterized protein n=1 Tax=Anguilla anguilla TaxID=7936 RepID=A0A0E9SBA8_ANGAN